MKKSSKIILASVMAISVTTGVLAYGGHHYFSNMTLPEKVDMFSNHFGNKLELNEYQQGQLDLLAGGIAETIMQVREQHPESEHQQMMDDLLNEKTLDQAALLQKINQKTTMINDKAPEMIALLAGFVDSLEPEQKAELKGLIQKRHGSGHGRFGGHQDQKHGWMMN